MKSAKAPWLILFLALLLTAAGAARGETLIGFPFSRARAVESTNQTTPLVVALVRSGDLTGTSTVDYTTVDITALAGSDYTAAAGTIEFQPGQSRAQISLEILDDGLREGIELFKLTLGNFVGANLTGTGIFVVDLQSNDSGFVIEGTGLTAYESISPFTIGVQSGTTLPGRVTVDYVLTPVTAMAGVDFEAQAGTLVFEEGEVRKEISVVVLPDVLKESTETLLLTLSNPSPGTSLGTPFATVQIVDDDPGFAFSLATVSVSEAASEFLVTVLRGSDLGEELSVDYATIDGTALAGLDYIATSGTLVFAADQATAQIVIRLLNDGIKEQSQNFRVQLSNPSGASALGNNRIVNIIILDNDPGIQFGNIENSTIEVGENGVFAAVPVTRQDDLGTSVTIDYATSDITALAGADYMATAGTLVFEAGETNKTIQIPLLNDSLKENIESFRITLRNPAGGASLGSRPTTTVTINDNDVGFEFAFPGIYVDEWQRDEVEVLVKRGGDGNDSATVDYATQPVTALEGVDYRETHGTLVFAPGETKKAIRLAVLNDGLRESWEDFRVVLSRPTGGSLGQITTFQVNIRDNDPGIQFETAYLQIVEGRAQQLRILRGNDGADPVSVEYHTMAGTATAGLDFVEASGTVTFGPGEEVKEITVQTINDGLVEPAENLRVSLRNPVGGLYGPNTFVGIALMDNDQAMSVETEGAEGPGGRILVRIHRGNDVPAEASFTYGTGDGTALTGQDFEPVAGMLAFGVGETVKEIQVPLLDDPWAEGKEYFQLILTNLLDGGTNLFAISIPDNELITSLDPGFPNQAINGPVQAMARQSDRKILVGGSFTMVHGIPRANIARLHADGSLDATFDPGQGPNSSVTALALDGQERILVGGWFSSFNGVSKPFLVRLQPDGKVDPTFKGWADYGISTIMVQPDGKVLLAGLFSKLNGSPRSFVGRLNEDGTLDAGFNANVVGFEVSRMLMQPDGKIVIAGNFQRVRGQPRQGLARLMSTGELDPAFDAKLAPRDGWAQVTGLALQTDGKLLVGGRFGITGGQTRLDLARMESDGTPDRSFEFHGVVEHLSNLALDPMGNVLVSMIAFVPDYRAGLLRISPIGRVDGAFGATTGWGIAAILPEPDGMVLIGGNFQSTELPASVYFARLVNDPGATKAFRLVRPAMTSFSETNGPVALQLLRFGHVDQPASVGLTTLDGTARAGEDYVPINTRLEWAALETSKEFSVEIKDDGRLEIRENFSVRLEEPSLGLKIFDPDKIIFSIVDNEVSPVVDRDFALAADLGTVTALAVQPDGRLLVAARFPPGTDRLKNYLRRFQPDGTLDPSFSGESAYVAQYRYNSQHVSSIVLREDGRILIGGEFVSIDGESRPGLAQLMPDGSLDREFAPAIFYFPTHLHLLPDGKLLVANQCGGLIRLNQNGSRDTSFTNAIVCVQSFAVNPNGSIWAVADGTLFLLTATGTRRDLRFEGSSHPISHVTALPEGKALIGGYFSHVTSNGKRHQRPSLARLNVDGSVDEGFDPTAALGLRGEDGAILADQIVNVGSIAPQADGKILVGAWSGNCGAYNGLGIVRLTEDGATDPFFPPVRLLTGPNLRFQAPSISTIRVVDENTAWVGGAFGQAGAKSIRNLARVFLNPPRTAVYFQTPINYGEENTGTAAVVIERAGDVSEISTVQLRTLPGTAENDLDFIPTTRTVEFGPLESRKTIQIPLVDDTLPEDDETFRLLLESPGANLVVQSSEASLSIRQNDRAGSFADAYGEGLTEFMAISITKIHVYADGRILVGGRFYKDSYYTYLPMIRFSTGGTRDRSLTSTGYYHFHAVLSDQSILTQWYGLARMDPDGHIDESFSTPTTGQGSYVRDVIEQPDGKLLAMGTFSQINGESYPGAVRLHADGSIDPSFQPGRDVRGTNAVMDAAGRFIFASLVRLNADGSVDETFRPAVAAENVDSVLAAQPDHGILLSGTFPRADGQPPSKFIGLRADGSLDESFQPRFESGPGTSVAPSQIIVQPNGRILCLGGFRSVNGTPRMQIARLLPNGSLDEDFEPVRSVMDRYGNEGSITAMAVNSSGRLAVGGNFDSINGIPTRALAMFELEEFVDFDVPEFDAAGKLHLRVAGRVGGVYKLERSADLLNWLEVETRTATTAEIDFAITPPDATHQYFRIRTP